jgi:hypothetical protein
MRRTFLTGARGAALAPDQHTARGAEDAWLAWAAWTSLVLICAAAIASALGVSRWLAATSRATQPIRTSQLIAHIVIGPTIGGAASPLYPGGTGDAEVAISNANPISVAITAITVRTGPEYAAGYADAALTIPKAGCTSQTSAVTWNGALAGRSSTHALAVPLVIGPHATLTVTFTGAARMGRRAPVPCEHAYFLMPTLTAGASTATTRAPSKGTARDAWMTD